MAPSAESSDSSATDPNLDRHNRHPFRFRCVCKGNHIFGKCKKNRTIFVFPSASTYRKRHFHPRQPPRRPIWLPEPHTPANGPIPCPTPLSPPAIRPRRQMQPRKQTQLRHPPPLPQRRKTPAQKKGRPRGDGPKALTVRIDYWRLPGFCVPILGLLDISSCGIGQTNMYVPAGIL